MFCFRAYILQPPNPLSNSVLSPNPVNLRQKPVINSIFHYQLQYLLWYPKHLSSVLIEMNTCETLTNDTTITGSRKLFIAWKGTGLYYINFWQKKIHYISISSNVIWNSPNMHLHFLAQILKDNQISAQTWVQRVDSSRQIQLKLRNPSQNFQME